MAPPTSSAGVSDTSGGQSRGHTPAATGTLQRLRGNVRLSAGLATITAAVVGVILSLALSFAANTLFDVVRARHVLDAEIPVPVASSLDGFALVVAAVAFVGIWRYRWSVVPVVLGSAAAGWLWSLLR